MHSTIGIIGGMGPAATVDLMNKIIEMEDASRDQDHIPMLVDSNTNIPDRTAAILSGGEDPVPELLRSAKRLEAMGADFLIIPCNTAHYFIGALEKEVSCPILNMPCETARFLKRNGVEKAAVLATTGTIRSGLYGSALSSEGIEPIYPDEEQQKVVMSLIYDFIKKGITDADKLPREEMECVDADLKARGAQAIILACTELPLAFRIMDLDKDYCVDATSVLAGAAVRFAGGTVRQGNKY